MLDIKPMRKYRGLTQKQLSEKIGVHQTAISQWENGTTHPRASVIPKILEALCCKIEEIYYEGESESARKNNLDN